MSEEADTLDHFWRSPPSSSGLGGDLQRLHDELRELLGCFIERRTMGDRDIRIARVYEERVNRLYDMLEEIRAKHALEDRSS